MNHTIGDEQARRIIERLIDLVIEGASEHGELRAEQYHAQSSGDDIERQRRYALAIAAAHGRRDAARDALRIVLRISHHTDDVTPF